MVIQNRFIIQIFLMLVLNGMQGGPYRAVAELNPQFWEWSTLPWNNGLTILRKSIVTNIIGGDMLAASIHEHAGLGNQIWRYVCCRVFAERLGYDWGVSHPGWRKTIS